jgi:hypothetical protein
MADDIDEQMYEETKRRVDPRRTGDVLERLEWRLMYGEYGTPLGIKVIGCAIVALLTLILYRIW